MFLFDNNLDNIPLESTPSSGEGYFFGRGRKFLSHIRSNDRLCRTIWAQVVNIVVNIVFIVVY
jgi:hypothetical protein